MGYQLRRVRAAHRRRTVEELYTSSQRPGYKRGDERATLLGKQRAYLSTLRSTVSGDPLRIELVVTECDGRLVALWLDGELVSDAQLGALHASYRCVPDAARTF